MLATYACFIDLRKAFDRVPPEALFRKLESLGIEGGCLELYCSLYRRLWTQLPLRIFEILAPLSFLFCRGARLDDPSSRVSFDLVINYQRH